MKDWLDLYPPDKRVLQDKRVHEPTIRTRPSHEKKLKNLEPQETLDLHGLTGSEALDELDLFLAACLKRNLRKVLIIHGKGLHSGGNSVLKPLVIRHLNSHPFVATFGQAASKHGGGGATWCVIKI